MATDGVTQAARAALAAAMTSGDVTCYEYDSADGPGGTYAALGQATWDLNTGRDQRMGIRSITFQVYLYQPLDGDAFQALAFQEAAFQNLLDGLGADVTLSNAVTDTEVSADARQSYYRDQPGGPVMAVVQFGVTVYPHPNSA